MKRIFLICFLLCGLLGFSQLTKNVGSYKFQDGTEVKEGMSVEFVKGAHPQVQGDYLWAFKGGSMPIPEKQCDSGFDGQKFVIEKVLLLKGIPDKENGIVIMFRKGNDKYYTFAKQAVSYKELLII